MKMVVTYEAADVRRLIQQDLARQGIQAEEANIKYVKNTVVVTVEVNGAAEVVEPPDAVREAVFGREPPEPTVLVERTPVTVDMSDVLARSASLGRTETSLYPARERALMDGETYEYPGDRRR